MLPAVAGRRARPASRRKPELRCVRVSAGAFFYVLRGGTRSTPRQLLTLAARCAPEVLTALSVPEDVPVRVFTPRRFPLRRAGAALCAILPQTQIPPQRLSVGIFDPDGALQGATDALLAVAGDVRIVTRCPERFDADVRRALRLYGAALTVGGEESLLAGCGVRVRCAADGTAQRARVLLTCGGADFETLPARLPQPFAPYCPDGVPTDLFAAALWEKCALEAPEWFRCAGILCGGETLDCAQAAALWRRELSALHDFS